MLCAWLRWRCRQTWWTDFRCSGPSSLLWFCFESHRLSLLMYHLAGEDLWSLLLLPPPVFFHSPHRSWYLQHKCSVVQFLPFMDSSLWSSTRIGICVCLGFCPHLWFRRWIPPHAERETQQGSKWKCSQHPAVCYFFAKVKSNWNDDWNDDSWYRLDSLLVLIDF